MSQSGFGKGITSASWIRKANGSSTWRVGGSAMVADSRTAGGSSRAQPRYSPTGDLRRCLHPTCRSLLPRAHLRPRGPPSKASTNERLERVSRYER
jgi:hypothetical protein